MQKPFNAEGLDLTFLFDSSYLEPSIAEAGNMELDLNAMPGFTPEQTSSLQRMLSRVIGEALDPLLKPLGEFLSAWDKSSPSVSVNTSSNRTSSPSLGFDHAIDPATGTSFATGPSNMGDGVATSSSISTDIRAVETVRPSSGDRVPAKRKATALDEAVIPAAKKECRFGLVGKETTLDPISNGYSTEVQVKEEYTPETLLHTSHPSSTEEDDESLFLSTAPSQFDSQPASSHGQVMGEYSTDTKSVEEQPEPAVRFAESSALLKVLFQNEPRIDKACPTRDYFAEKPASLAHPPNIYGRSFPRLPYDAPRGCAHIIDVTRFHTNKTRSSIRMADLIVTFLFYYCPDLLYAFLNVNRHPEFSFSRIEAVNGGRRDFSTERTGLIVTCSFHQLENIEFKKITEEENYDQEALIQQFGAIGHEKMQFTSEMKPWGKWTTNACSIGRVSRQEYPKDYQRRIERCAHAFAVFVFESELWKESEGVTFEGGATNV